MANKTLEQLSALAAADASAADLLLAWDTSAAHSQKTKSVRFDVLMGALAELGGRYIVTNPKYGGGAVGDGVTDDTAAIQAAITAAPTGSTIVFPRPSGNYLVTSTLQVSVKGLTFLLDGGADQRGINYTGTGACIQLGTDDGLNYDDSNYNGVAQGFAYVGGSLNFTGTKVALSNGLGAGYGSGTYAIRDWRGGYCKIEDASFSGWDYWFWGVQSDLNTFRRVSFGLCHGGCYLGPRSDQATFDKVWSFHNDRILHIEGSKGHHINHWITDSDGSASINPVLIRSSSPTTSARNATTRTAANIVFDTPWLESAAGGSALFDVEAFIEIGTADANQNGTVTIRNPIIIVNPYNTPSVQHTLYLVKADQVRGVVVDGMTGIPGGIPWNNLRSVFKIANAGAATTVPDLWFRDYETWSGRLIENYSATAVAVHIDAQHFTNYTNNVVGGTGSVNMGQLGLQRRLQHNNAAPSSGTTLAGDMTLNRNWAVGGVWSWISGGGSPGTQYAQVFPSVSADRGDANQTLVIGTDEMVQRFATTLTANRTVTLSTTGATDGCAFRIVRTGLGAFTLDVGGLKTIASATAAFVDVMYDGTAWRLTGYGTL